MDDIVFASDLLPSDKIVLKNLADDVRRHNEGSGVGSGVAATNANGRGKKQNKDETDLHEWGVCPARDANDLKLLKDSNDPSSESFEPSVFSTVDMRDISKKSILYRHVLVPYMAWAKGIVRHEMDIIMLTHMILYFTTSVPSAIWMFHRPSVIHGVLHCVMQFYYMGSYTLMMHQHIHNRGVLAKTPLLGLFDTVFPYITDPLMGHTWNTYFYHHVKHHHVEANGPDDVSSTIRYQRDDIFHLLHYFGRFLLFIWVDLPLYFARRGNWQFAFRAAGSEFASYAMLYMAGRYSPIAATFVFFVPLGLMRVGLMTGNWGQHAFVDADDPESDYRSSITVIDVPSNRFSFNDGYHTSHHLNPLRHWRDHPVHFLDQKEKYSKEKALVFHNIDYIMITISLVLKRYEHLARCLVPIGDQIDMTIEERVAMLKRHTRQFSEEEVRQKFAKYKKSQ